MEEVSASMWPRWRLVDENHEGGLFVKRHHVIKMAESRVLRRSSVNRLSLSLEAAAIGVGR